MAETTRVWIVERELERGILFGDGNRTYAFGYALAVTGRGRLCLVINDDEPCVSFFDPSHSGQSPVEVMDG